MDFIQSKSMGCSSVADLLPPVGGVDDGWAEGGVEGGRAAECDEVVMGFFIIVWGWVALNRLHWLLRIEASCFHSAQVLGIRCSQ